MKLMPWRNKQNDTSHGLTPPTRWDRFDMERLFDRFLSDPWSPGERGLFGRVGPWTPPVDITESEKQVVVRSEIPGVDPENLSITVSGDVLTLRGEKSDSSEQKGENFYHAERHFGSFRRDVRLPATVDSDRVNAEYENGVLTITLERKEGAAVKKIPVSAK